MYNIFNNLVIIYQLVPNIIIIIIVFKKKIVSILLFMWYLLYIYIEVPIHFFFKSCCFKREIYYMYIQLPQQTYNAIKPTAGFLFIGNHLSFRIWI